MVKVLFMEGDGFLLAFKPYWIREDEYRFSRKLRSVFTLKGFFFFFSTYFVRLQGSNEYRRRIERKSKKNRTTIEQIMKVTLVNTGFFHMFLKV